MFSRTVVKFEGGPVGADTCDVTASRAYAARLARSHAKLLNLGQCKLRYKINSEKHAPILFKNELRKHSTLPIIRVYAQPNPGVKQRARGARESRASPRFKAEKSGVDRHH